MINFTLTISYDLRKHNKCHNYDNYEQKDILLEQTKLIHKTMKIMI